MKSTAICLILAAIGSISLYAQDSVKTINTNRIFYDWRDSGLNCEEEVTDYWYVFRNEMDTKIRDTIEYYGPAIYIGIRNGWHLYFQGLRTATCNEITDFLKQDSNFINVLPPSIHEKVSQNIYRDSGSYYVDSTNRIIMANIWLNTQMTDEIMYFLKSCVDSVFYDEPNTILAYGTRDEMYCIAENENVKEVFDTKPDPGMKSIMPEPAYNGRRNVASVNQKTYDLKGRTIPNRHYYPTCTLRNGKLHPPQWRFR